MCQFNNLYRVSQEERSVFWEVVISVILSKRVYVYMLCSVVNGFRGTAVHCTVPKLLIRKRYYVDITGSCC
jgi:hypothetical protein